MEVFTLEQSSNQSEALKQSQIDMLFGWQLTREKAKAETAFHQSLWKNNPFSSITQYLPTSTLETSESFTNDEAMGHIPFPSVYGLWEKEDGAYEGFALSSALIHLILQQNFGYLSEATGELSLFETSLFENYIKKAFEKANRGKLTLGASVYTLAPLWKYETITAKSLKQHAIQAHFYKGSSEISQKNISVCLKSINLSETELAQIKRGDSLKIGKITPNIAIVENTAYQFGKDTNGYYIGEKA